jgi:hypothetical protein
MACQVKHTRVASVEKAFSNQRVDFLFIGSKGARRALAP